MWLKGLIGKYPQAKEGQWLLAIGSWKETRGVFSPSALERTSFTDHCNSTLGIRIFFSCPVLVCIACFRRSRTGIFPPLDRRWEAEAASLWRCSLAAWLPSCRLHVEMGLETYFFPFFSVVHALALPDSFLLCRDELVGTMRCNFCDGGGLTVG